MKRKCTICKKILGHGGTALIYEDGEVKTVCIECQRTFESKNLIVGKKKRPTVLANSRSVGNF